MTDNAVFHVVNLDDVLFDPQPMWLPLFDAPDSPAIHLTPLDWTQYDFAQRLSTVFGATVVNPRTMLQQLVKLTKPDAWRGFERKGAPVEFNADLLLKLLTSNVLLGTAFNSRLQAIALAGKQHEEAAQKNSDAGDDTPSIAPGTAKAKKAPSPTALNV